MDFKALRKGSTGYTGGLSDSERISKEYPLEELVAGARQYAQEMKLLWDEINSREAMIRAEQKRILELKKESDEISFGQLLTGAIGIKLRDEKTESQPN